MKFKGAVLALMSLMILMTVMSAASAGDGSLNDTLKEGLANDFDISNGTIHLQDRVYEESDITIDESVRIIGSNNTVFEGKSQNSLFTIAGNAHVTFENIRFNNFTKDSNGAVFDIKKSASVILINCTFTNNVMAISNYGSLEIYNSYFNNNSLITQNAQGGAISNNGKLYIENTTFANSYGPRYSNGATIYNNGDLTLNRTTISNAYAGEDSKGSAIFNNGLCLMVNSIVENNVIERYNFNYMHGCVYNQGNLTATGSIFRNNTGKYVKPNTWYEGSPTIYNVGNINLAYNAFVANVHFNGLSTDVFNNGARYICLDFNWWDTNDNPIDANKVNQGNEIASWVVLDVTPDYSALDVNESVSIRAEFRLNDGSEIRDSPLPDFDITIFDGESFHGDSFVFSRTQEKGQYKITARACSVEKTAVVDVGKIPVFIDFSAGNITYPDDLYLEFSSNVNQAMTVMMNDKSYTINVNNNRANLTVSNLDAGTYDIAVIYDGDDDHFKAFNSTTVTVARMQVTLAIENVSDIRPDESMTAKVILDPNVSPVTAQLYINGVFNRTIYLYDAINNLTFSNLREGNYTIEISIAKGENYVSANASKSFNVGRYDPKLSINVDDVMMGQNATARISACNFTGNVILSINGANSSVLIRNDTNITLPNLGGGYYSVSVIFEGNSLYMPSNASAKFRVIRNDPGFGVEIKREDRRAMIYVTTNESCTGQVGLYVNFEWYSQNLTAGKATFDVGLDNGTNYIFVFCDGDENFENATYNTTIIIDEDFLLLGEDVEGLEYNNVTYSIVLVEKNRITMPNRNVSISFNGQTCNVVTDKNGVAGITLSLPAGTYTVKAAYLNRTVTNTIKVRQIAYELKCEDIEYGETEHVEVIFTGNVTGTVRFNVNGITHNVSVSGSRAVLNITDLKIGTYEVTATYFNEMFTSKSVKSSFEVRKAAPKIDVRAENIAPGEVETIEITLLSNITGHLTVTVDSRDYQIKIDSSTLILNISNLEIGIHNVTVTYGGSENFTSFTSSEVFSVRNLTSAITLNVSESRFGEDVVIDAILDETATGKITFKVSDRTQTVEVINGRARCTFSNLAAGTYRIDAEYGGDLKFQKSSIYGFFKVLKADSTVSIVTDKVELGENIMIYAVMSPNATGEVYFSMVGYYSPRAKQIVDGSAFWYISPLEAGRYTVVATYAGDANHNPSNATFILKVSKVRSVLQVAINDASVNDRVRINVRLTDVDGNAISGKVSVSFNKRTYTVNVADGAGSLVIGSMNAGNYIFQAAYEGSDDYSTSSVAGSFIVAENLLETTLTSENVTAFYKGNQTLKFKLTSNGKPVAQAALKLVVAGRTYDLTTDNSGIAAISLDLNPGTYVAKVTFAETLSHTSSNATASLKVLSTINATDVVKLYGSGTQYFAMFYTSQGKALSNKQVSFILNGKTYRVKTLPNGVVRLNININPGSYRITAINPQTGQKVTNSIRIYAKIMANGDLTQYYGANKLFKVRIYNATTGKPVSAGVKVTFKVNKRTYTAKTNKIGYAGLRIKLKAGQYKITTSYDGYKVSNRIVVKPVLTAYNILGKNVKKLKFKVKLVGKNGKPLKAKTIKFKFRGKAYKAKTNKKGVASVTLKNLKVGNYLIVSAYGKSKITNTIKIRK